MCKDQGVDLCVRIRSIGVVFPTTLREAIIAKNEDQINQTLTDEKVKKCFLDWAELHSDCFKHNSFLISLYNRAVIGEQRYFSYEPIKLKMNMPMDIVEGYYEAGLLNSAQTVKVYQKLRTHLVVRFEKLRNLPSEDLVHLLSATRESGYHCFQDFFETNSALFVTKFPLFVDLLREKCSGEQIVQLFSLKWNGHRNPIITRFFPQKALLYPLLREKCTDKQLVQLCSLRDVDNNPVFIYKAINKAIFPILKEKCTSAQLADLYWLRDGVGAPAHVYEMFDEIPMPEKIVLILDVIGTRMDAPTSTHKRLDIFFSEMNNLYKEEVLKALKITGENGKSLIHIPYFFKKAADLLYIICTWRELFDLLSIKDKQGNTPVLIPGVSHIAIALMTRAEQKLKETLLRFQEHKRKLNVLHRVIVSMGNQERMLKEELSQLQDCKHTLEDHENQFGISLPIVGGLEEKPGSPSSIPTLRHLAYEQLNKMGNDVEFDNS